MSAPTPSRDQAVQNMFDRIAGRYDLLNRVISFRLDGWWRRQAIRTMLSADHPLILDLGTGTGDLVFSAAKSARGQGRMIGLDFSPRMLSIAQAKRSAQPYASATAFVLGSAMVVPFRSVIFDGVMSAFVLRNVSDLSAFFAEALRVLKPGGKFVSLDMFPPSKHWFAVLYGVYFYHLMPWLGGLLARDRKAYKYLSESVRQFVPPEAVAKLIEDSGFERVTTRKFLCGAVCMHIAIKGNSLPA